MKGVVQVGRGSMRVAAMVVVLIDIEHELVVE